MFDKRALVIGVSGIVGQNLAHQLLAEGDWSVAGVSRRPLLGYSGVRTLSVDVLDESETTRILSEVEPTHVFFGAWTRMATETENVRVNGAMVRNVLEAVTARAKTLRHVALVTGTKNYLGPFESYAKNQPRTPFREDQPRLPGDNFYYTQEDIVFDYAKRHDFGFSIHRPHTIVGYAVGNLMNIGVTLATYASICKATNKPLVFPGSRAQFEGLTDVTDARVLARHLSWASTTPGARNEAFNVVNGDVFRWKHLWSVIARYFGVEAAPSPGEPLERQLEGADDIWSRLVTEHRLQPTSFRELASPWHTDADLGRPFECVNDMSKSRRLGFLDYQETERSFIDLFDRLRRERIIP